MSPKYHNPYYKDPQKGTPNFGKPFKASSWRRIATYVNARSSALHSDLYMETFNAHRALGRFSGLVLLRG